MHGPLRQIVYQKGPLGFVAGCFASGAFLVIVLLVVSWIHDGKAARRIMDIGALDAELSEKQDQLRHLDDELHRHKDGIDNAKFDFYKLSAAIDMKRKEDNELSGRLIAQRQEADQLQRSINRGKRLGAAMIDLEREYQEKRAVVHDATCLAKLDAALDKHAIAHGLRPAIDGVFQGRAKDFETLFVRWYKDQAIKEGAAQQLAGRVEQELTANAEAERKYLAAKRSLEGYQTARGPTDGRTLNGLLKDMKESEAGLRHRTHLLVVTCDTVLRQYSQTLAAQELAGRAEVKDLCKKYAGPRTPLVLDGADQDRAAKVLASLEAHRRGKLSANSEPK